MIKLKKQKPLLLSLLALTAGCIVFSSSAAVLAETSDSTAAAETSSAETQKATPERGKGFKGGVLPELSSAVTDGILTQSESDSITAYLKDNRPARGTDLFTALVDGKVLTAEKAEALKTYLDTKRDAEHKERLTKALSAFVSDSTITQAQADKIVAALLAAKPERKLDGTRPEFVNPLTALVTDGTITQVQADKISAVLPMGGPRGGKGRPGRGFCKNPNGNSCTEAPAV